MAGVPRKGLFKQRKFLNLRLLGGFLRKSWGNSWIPRQRPIGDFYSSPVQRLGRDLFGEPSFIAGVPEELSPWPLEVVGAVLSVPNHPVKRYQGAPPRYQSGWSRTARERILVCA
jgi:hypothetical protein